MNPKSLPILAIILGKYNSVLLKRQKDSNAVSKASFASN